MGVLIDDAAVEPVVRMLAGAIDTGDGGTDEQRAVLAALVAGAWGRTDLDVAKLDPLAPSEVAAALPDAATRKRGRELLVLMELCRHPLTEAQVARVDEYATALDAGDEGIDAVRDLVRDGAEHATADFFRYVAGPDASQLEPSMAAKYAQKLDQPDHELAARLRAMHDLPKGTLGWAYVEFYRRNGITLPGDDPNEPSVFVSHDMCHVIGGYEPTGQGEIALGAMQLAVTDSEAHWVGFMGNLALHEGGYLQGTSITPKTASLARPGAKELVADAFRRGAASDDFTTADHLAMADVPLEEVRARFNIPPLTLPQ